MSHVKLDMENISNRTFGVLFLCGILFGAIFVAGQYSRQVDATPGGTLFVGADTEEFNGLQDRIGKFQTDGPNVVIGGIVPLGDGDYANGMTVVGSQLLTGTVGEPFNPAPSGQNLTFRDFDTVPQSSAVADIPPGAFNEDLAYDGVSVWRAHFQNTSAGSIRELDSNNLNGPALQVDNLAFGPVGMTYANGELWITAWAQQQVGTWDPVTNAFSPVFQTPDFAGCLAFDDVDQVLWVGMRGGLVVPYNLTGSQLNAGFQPFGDIPDTIDGCAFAEPVNDDPDCSGAVPSESTLWPPNHKMKNISIGNVTDPDGDNVTITIDSIFQDEPTNGLGDGDQSPDGAGVGTDTAQVRAERSGTGDGRVYHISFTADDGNGGTCTGEVLVSVPHDQNGNPAVDQGALFDSTVA